MQTFNVQCTVSLVEPFLVLCAARVPARVFESAVHYFQVHDAGRLLLHVLALLRLQQFISFQPSYLFIRSCSHNFIFLEVSFFLLSPVRDSLTNSKIVNLRSRFSSDAGDQLDSVALLNHSVP